MRPSDSRCCRWMALPEMVIQAGLNIVCSESSALRMSTQMPEPLRSLPEMTTSVWCWWSSESCLVVSEAAVRLGGVAQAVAVGVDDLVVLEDDGLPAVGVVVLHRGHLRLVVAVVVAVRGEEARGVVVAVQLQVGGAVDGVVVEPALVEAVDVEDARVLGEGQGVLRVVEGSAVAARADDVVAHLAVVVADLADVGDLVVLDEAAGVVAGALDVLVDAQVADEVVVDPDALAVPVQAELAGDVVARDEEAGVRVAEVQVAGDVVAGDDVGVGQGAGAVAHAVLRVEALVADDAHAGDLLELLRVAGAGDGAAGGREVRARHAGLGVVVAHHVAGHAAVQGALVGAGAMVAVAAGGEGGRDVG